MTEVPATAAGTAAPPALAAVPSPDALAPLTPYQRRKKREEEREREREKRRAAREARKATPESEGGKAPPPESTAEVPERTDAERSADLAVFLAGVIWPVLALAARLFGWDVSALSAAEAAEDATAWVPVARRYRWLDLAATWAAAPARLVARVRAHATRRAKPESKASA